jgi:hypothetical protein
LLCALNAAPVRCRGSEDEDVAASVFTPGAGTVAVLLSAPLPAAVRSEAPADVVKEPISDCKRAPKLSAAEL